MMLLGRMDENVVVLVRPYVERLKEVAGIGNLAGELKLSEVLTVAAYR